jgi:oxygen-dependent protoporphyrinogen oxidase
MVTQHPFDVAVVGGGFAGLAAATTLARQGRRVVVIEAAARVGGRARTASVDGVRVETGAQLVVHSYRATRELMRSQAAGVALLPNPISADVRLEDGMARVWPLSGLLLGRALPLRQKLRLLRLLKLLATCWSAIDSADIAASRALDDESAADFLDRKIGAEAADRFVGPVVRSLFAWDLEHTSMCAVLAMAKALFKGPRVYAVAGGLTAFASSLTSGITLMTASRVRSLDPSSGPCCTLRVEQEHDTADVQAATVVLAVPAHHVLPIAEWLPATARDMLTQVNYSSTAVIVARATSDVEPGRAVVLPASWHSDVAAVHRLSPLSRDVEGPAFDPPLLAVTLSSEGFQRLHDMPDGELGRRALETARRSCPSDFAPEPDPLLVQCWPAALPVFDTGYVARLRRLRESLRAFPTLALAGDYMCGPSIEGAVRSGLRAAERIRGTA